MMRLLPSFMVASIVIAGLASGCIPRHPPHTPQPVPEVPTPQPSPSDQSKR